MLFAISTTRGIQAESDENASGSSAGAARTTAPRPAAVGSAATAAAAEPQVERALLLGQDADRDVEAADEVVEARRPRSRPSGRG